MKYCAPVVSLSTVILTVWLASHSALGAPVPVLQARGGVSDFGTVANSATVQMNGQMTLEAWIYPTAWRSYTGREKHGLNFMYKGRIGSYIDFVFALQENGILCLGNTWGYIGVMNRRVPLNQWTHVAVTVNEATGSFVFYINGVNCGGGSGWQGASPSRTSFLGPSSHPLYVGGFNQLGWGYNNDNFRGMIADVRMWNIVRTPAEIAENYQKQLRGTEPGLAAYWTFADRWDKSPNGNHMTLGGNASFLAGQGPDLQGAGEIDVELTVPTNSHVVAQGADLTLMATALAVSGGVAHVDFYANTTLLSRDTEAPYTATWSNVPAGIHTLNARATNDAGHVGTSEDVIVRAHGPFGGAPTAVPGHVEAEQFDLGGQELGYHETTPINEGGKYRPGEAVGISADASASNGYVVGWTKAGEWMDYVLDVATTGTYRIQTRVAGVGAGGQFRILINGTDVSGDLSVPDTGAWNGYQWVACDGVLLAQGACTMRVVMVANGSSGMVGAFDCFVVEPPPPPGQQPFNATYAPWSAIDGVEFEDFDHGGMGVAYHDASAVNEGGLYRFGEGVDIVAQSQASKGFTVGWTLAGEWLEYTAQIPSNGTYDIELRVANSGSGATCRLLIDGREATGPLAIPNTGSWTDYQTVLQKGLQLRAGVSVFRFELLGVSSASHVGAFDTWRLVPAGPPFAISEMSGDQGTGTILRWGPLTNRFRIHHATSLMPADWAPVTDWQVGTEYELPLGDMGTSGFYRVESHP
ncbi:MAG: carbohydrate-binding protein [Kiritimatiellae bacterium]|nr:carbohydrate-binding protein [Kiritimatiellia bacterium]